MRKVIARMAHVFFWAFLFSYTHEGFYDMRSAVGYHVDRDIVPCATQTSKTNFGFNSLLLVIFDRTLVANACCFSDIYNLCSAFCLFFDGFFRSSAFVKRGLWSYELTSTHWVLSLAPQGAANGGNQWWRKSMGLEMSRVGDWWVNLTMCWTMYSSKGLAGPWKNLRFQWHQQPVFCVLLSFSSKTVQLQKPFGMETFDLFLAFIWAGAFSNRLGLCCRRPQSWNQSARPW